MKSADARCLGVQGHHNIKCVLLGSSLQCGAGASAAMSRKGEGSMLPCTLPAGTGLLTIGAGHGIGDGG